jgi:hypothetical protein
LKKNNERKGKTMYIGAQEDYDLVTYSVSLPARDGDPAIVNQPLMAVNVGPGEHGFCRARALFAAASACDSTGDWARDVVVHESHYGFSHKDEGGRCHSALRTINIALGEIARNAARMFPDEETKTAVMSAIESSSLKESNAAVSRLYGIVMQVEAKYLGDPGRREKDLKSAMEAIENG